LIRPLTEGDFAQAVALTDTMDWGLGEDDFSFMKLMEPEGCFVAVFGGKVVGLITSISFGSVGWVGNVIVQSAHRGEGIGRELVERALDYLEKKGVTTVGLYAYQNVVRFYEQFGFIKDRDFVWLVCPEAAWKGTPASSLSQSRLEDLLKLDEELFGAPRRRLLKPIFEGSHGLCRGIIQNGRLVAYVMGSKGKSAEIGPWACLRGYEQESLSLFQSLADEVKGLEVFVGVPAWRSEVVDFLLGIGFKKRFILPRMYRGPPLPDEGVLAIESLERG